MEKEKKDKDTELMIDRNVEVEIENKEWQRATNTGTIPKATIRSIDIISKPFDRDRSLLF